MTGFAVRVDNHGWRSVSEAGDCGEDEVFQTDQPDLTGPDPWPALRVARDTRLTAALAMLDRHRNQVDFGLATTLTGEQATAWAVYAQALRDLPETTIDPAVPEWPEAPQ